MPMSNLKTLFSIILIIDDFTLRLLKNHYKKTVLLESIFSMLRVCLREKTKILALTNNS